MNENIDDIIDFYIDQNLTNINYSKIRSELNAKGLKEETIKYIIKKVDDYLIEEDINKANRSKSNELKIIGYVLMISGGIVTITTYFGLLDLSGVYLIAYGPIIGGYAMILASRKKQRNEKQKNTFKNKFRRK